ncbi:MAG: helix-turn-helix domain-containing protein [Myxococcota bacterium]
MPIDFASPSVPDAVLAPELAILDIPDAPFTDETTFGDAAGSLVVHLGPPCRFEGDAPRPSGTAYVLGPRATPFALRTSRRIETLMLRLAAPDLARLLDLRPAELHGRAFPLDDARPDLAREVEARLSADLRESARALSTWLTARLRRAPPVDARVAEALRTLHRRGGAMRVDALGRHLRLHPRTLERLFRRHVGASPKLTAAILRARTAIRALGAGRRPASEVATGVGFADQAHMIRHIHRFAGAPPGELLCRPRLGLVSLVPAHVLLGR